MTSLVAAGQGWRAGAGRQPVRGRSREAGAYIAASSRPNSPSPVAPAAQAAIPAASCPAGTGRRGS